MTSIELKAHAKVNLFLKVLNKRKDSYHNILTLFERISLADKVKISKISKGIVISSDRFITRNPKDNLAYKAARAILNKRKVNSGVKIEIKKNIPAGAGLGGGSSDAAQVLIGIDRLFNLKLGRMRLIGLASQLGADIPFFILNTPFAIGRSRGDRLEVINSKKRFWHLLIHPGFKLSTKEVYQAFDASTSPRIDPARDNTELVEVPKHLTRRSGGVKIRPHSLKLRGGVLRSLGEGRHSSLPHSMLYNDLEDIAKSKNDIIGKIIKRLACILSKKAILSGSGPSVFCLYRTRKEATRDRDILLKSVPARERKPWRVFVVKTMD